MPKLTIAESHATSRLAAFLYDFLPGNAHPFANPSISFAGVAASIGLGQFWTDGSKQPAITTLLQKTLEYKRDKFCPLIEEIVKTAFGYPKSQITREKIEQLNELVKVVGFKIPALWDSGFLKSLPSSKPVSCPAPTSAKRLKELLTQLLTISQMTDTQGRGYAFEKFLTELFTVHGLQPRQPFKLLGEQIDGSIDLNSEIYLIEARWRDKQANNTDLLAFSGKVTGKATWARGIFISYSGFTEEGLEAFQKGRATNLVCFSGQDLYFILENNLQLTDVIQMKARKAAEEGVSFVPVTELTYKYQ